MNKIVTIKHFLLDTQKLLEQIRYCNKRAKNSEKYTSELSLNLVWLRYIACLFFTLWSAASDNTFSTLIRVGASQQWLDCQTCSKNEWFILLLDLQRCCSLLRQAYLFNALSGTETEQDKNNNFLDWECNSTSWFI